MARKRVKEPATQREAGPIDIGKSRFPLGHGMALKYVRGVYRLVFGAESFLVVSYGAQDVYGLIATEHNGISILWENRAKVLILEHCRDEPGDGPSVRQQLEYARICGMNAEAFREFVNNHHAAACHVLVDPPPPIFQPKLDWKPEDFDFIPGVPAGDKVWFLQDLVRFLVGHCDRDLFTVRIYEGLHQRLGHVAHVDATGFHAEWFGDPERRVRFLVHRAEATTHSSSAWHDVNKALKKWIAGDEGQRVFHHYQGQVNAQREAAERAQLAALKAKYEGASA